VKAGVTMSVSNGSVEGHINRLKMLKWQMYGRAKIDLRFAKILVSNLKNITLDSKFYL